MQAKNAKFSIGQLVEHRLFHYRGVIIDVDPIFQGTEDWYDQVALTRPPKDEPWYRVLVHNGVHETYAAERNLEVDTSKEPVNHPLVDAYFDNFENSSYIISRQTN
ncbi:MAG: heat shock protein HspQ [Gammaproteobacteria bacterium]